MTQPFKCLFIGTYFLHLPKLDLMIQRIQSVWLLLASVAAFLTLQFPYYIGTNAKNEASYRLTGKETLPLLLTTVAVGLLAAIIIFLFKKRKLQLRLCVLGIFLEAFLIFLYYREVQTYAPGGGYALTAILHSLIVIFFVLAARGIVKDEKMIKDSDRLR